MKQNKDTATNFGSVECPTLPENAVISVIYWIHESNWDCISNRSSLLSWGDRRAASRVPLQPRYGFHLDVIAQLHVYHPWHWRNVSFLESPHKTLIYKCLAEISPLAKLPSQAVDFQTECLQSAAQHGTTLSEEIRQRVGDVGGGDVRAWGKTWVLHVLLIMSYTFMKAALIVCPSHI